MAWLLWLGLIACLLALAVVGCSAYGSRRWTERTRAHTSRLHAARVATAKFEPASAGRFDARELEGLPGPVQRYFRAVLKDGQPIVTAAAVRLAGTFNRSATGEQWRPFTSQQRVITRRPGFVWDARISLLPGVALRVIDSYVAGEGLLRAAVMGLFTVAEIGGRGEIARGELMRFLAEAPWYPTALLPSQGVRWEAVDERAANATIADGPITLTLLFRFNDAGLIDAFFADARGAMVGTETVMLPWEGRWSDYRAHDGMTVPFAGEVAWMRPTGRASYFHGSVTSLAYEWSP
jgi:hypothetical protein